WRPVADSELTQQPEYDVNKVGIGTVRTLIFRCVLEAKRGDDLRWHIPALHQPGADLLPGDTQQVAIDSHVTDARIGLDVATYRGELWRKDMCQHQITKVVQETGEAGKTLARPQLR